jgi:transcriptional regulator with XRE-family HTH domain
MTSVTANQQALDSPQQWEFSPELLRRLRKERRITITNFAAAIGRSSFSQHHYEHGDKAPPADIVARMAAVLGVQPGDLFVPVEEPPRRLRRTNKS